MTSTMMLLVLLVALALAALLFAGNSAVRRSTRSDWLDGAPLDGSIEPNEADLVGSEIAAAERLRHEAAAATDPEDKATLTKLADEAESDVDKLRTEFDDGKLAS